MALNRRARTRPGRCRALQPQSRPPTHNPATARPDRAAGPASHEGRGRQGRNGQPSQAIPWLPRFQRPERDAVGSGVFRQHASNRCRHRARSSAACPAHRLLSLQALGPEQDLHRQVQLQAQAVLLVAYDRHFQEIHPEQGLAILGQGLAGIAQLHRLALVRLQAQERRRQHERHLQPRQIVGVPRLAPVQPGLHQDRLGADIADIDADCLFAGGIDEARAIDGHVRTGGAGQPGPCRHDHHAGQARVAQCENAPADHGFSPPPASGRRVMPAPAGRRSRPHRSRSGRARSDSA